LATRPKPEAGFYNIVDRATFRQAIDATTKKMPVEQHAEQHPELRAAIEAWKKGLLTFMLE